MPKIQIGPSILNANLANLSQVSRGLLADGADYLHLDVMDGQFVPNLTFGHTMVQCLRKDLGKEPFFDVHMMVAKPLQWIEPMADAGCSQYTYHVEAAQDQSQVIRRVREAGMRVGLAIKPATGVEVILPYVDSVDMVLVMTVEPGFGGQQFMVDMMRKVKTLREKYKQLGKCAASAHTQQVLASSACVGKLTKCSSSTDIEVDGGVGPSTIGECCSAGANMIVSGTAITQSDDPKRVMRDMKACATAALAAFES